MTHRGRGCLEVKPNSNPFLQPINDDYGIKPREHIEWKVDGKVPATTQATHKVDGNFSFLYSRESDKIGGRLPKPEKERPRVLTKTEFLKKQRESAVIEPISYDSINCNNNESSSFNETSDLSAEEMVKAYNHQPKSEDPRFSTTNVLYWLSALLLTVFLLIIYLC
jgi:hypothetical protein